MSKKSKNRYIATVLILGERNANDHVYEDNDNIRSSLGELDHRAKNGLVFGQLGYPENFDISVSNASHKVNGVKIIDKEVKCEIEILDTPAGQQAKELLDGLVFRPRSVGTVSEDGTVSVTKVFSIDAIPKTDDAFRDIEGAQTIIKLEDNE